MRCNCINLSFVRLFQCTCPRGFAGKDCETNINDCKPGICDNGGVCHDGVDDYRCACAAGYNGRNCSNDIDECKGVYVD